MAKPKEIGFWDGISPNAKAITILLVVLAVLKLGSIWLQKPKIEVTAEKKLSTINVERRNVVRTTHSTSPDGTIKVEEVRDTSVTNTGSLESSLTSSLSVPIGETARYWGLSVGYDPLKQEFWGGGSYQPLLFLPVNLGIKSNFKDRLLLEGTIKF